MAISRSSSRKQNSFFQETVRNISLIEIFARFPQENYDPVQPEEKKGLSDISGCAVTAWLVVCLLSSEGVD